ncbi:ABC transporter ATP-binding protein [Lentilitoribacter sp. EG35]|jgi:ABC-type sugar transport system ATPase subunit|uniref:ABC transporter ATP-binding protein n=1 Tax=Lentilitoribacter sp. EG35 TaxID=3234192 RepID=UPI00346077D9
MADVKITNLKKAYGNVVVLEDINLHIADGEFAVLVGPSGCGKSTLLRSISGLEKVNGGTLEIGGTMANNLTPIERGVGMVFQSYALYPHMTVAENLGFGLKISGVSAADRAPRVQEVAEMLKLDQLLDRRPRALSGGQRQRVAIGRSLARQPKIFLFDEPLSNLDAALRVEMRVELSKLHQDLKSTMIYVTHDQVEAMTMADRIVVMDAGRIMQVGKPLELFNSPKNRFVAGFLGQPATNFLKVTHVAVEGDATRIHFAGGSVLFNGTPSTLDNAIELGLRPDSLFPVGEGAEVQTTVELAEQLGDETLLHTVLDSGEKLVVKLKGQHAYKPGDKAGFRSDISAPMLFNGSGDNLFSN